MSNSQSKLASISEALFSTAIGLVLAVAVTQAVCWAHDIPMTMHSNLILTAWMTLLSIVRSYVVRRMWNSEFWKGLVTRERCNNEAS